VSDTPCGKDDTKCSAANAGGLQTASPSPEVGGGYRTYYGHGRRIPEARGNAFKIAAHLLTDLPAGETYRVVFMRRNLDEVIASQRAMLERLGQRGD
jgi:hypothetical protein